MKAPENLKKQDAFPAFSRAESFVLPVISLVCLTATFFVSISDLAFETKTFVFISLIAFYIVLSTVFYFWQKRHEQVIEAAEKTAGSIFSPDIERHLIALEEASQFFGASLKPADMFRLAASRINEMIPFASAAVFLVEEDRQTFRAAGASGLNAREIANLKINSLHGVSGKAFVSKKIQADENLTLEKSVIAPENLKNLESAIAAPLFCNGTEVFGVLSLYGDEERSFAAETHLLLEAISERVAPLFLSSLAFERTMANALTDSLTNLPNERAFFLVLENQLAESQRQREHRPLTVLAIDIDDFAGLNQKYGHAAGDRALAFAAETIKAQLRKMDFLARTTGDEFLVVLPTASEEIAEEIIERIERVFEKNAFEIAAGGAKVNLELNFGAATFIRDGETSGHLLENARLEKHLTKAGLSGKVIAFPKEFVH